MAEIFRSPPRFCCPRSAHHVYLRLASAGREQKFWSHTTHYMLLQLLTTLGAGLIGGALCAQTLYVTANGSGDGSSWQEAANLQEILPEATSGTQIWVARGTYYPTPGIDRTASFHVPDGVRLFGGFTGNESGLVQRDPAANETILSGEIGSTAPDDNSYNVVYTEAAGPNTLIDGFTITGGYAMGVGRPHERVRCGGGWYNNGALEASNPTVSNCKFSQNVARDGGAIYNNGKGGEASPTLESCTFFENRAADDGGALYNYGGRGGKSSPVLTACTIQGNAANYGAGLFNHGGKGESSPALQGCTITQNVAHVQGGTLYNMDINGVTEPQLDNCSLAAKDGNGIHFSSPRL